MTRVPERLETFERDSFSLCEPETACMLFWAALAFCLFCDWMGWLK